MPAQPKTSKMFQCAGPPREAANTAKPQGIQLLVGKIQSREDRDLRTLSTTSLYNTQVQKNTFSTPLTPP